MYNSMYYNNFFPYQSLGNIPKRGLISGITSGIGKVNWGSLLTNTQKTLNVINQAIPVYYQVKPIYNNAKTMFRVFGALKDNPTNTSASNNHTSNIVNSNNQKQESTNQNQPIFFS